MINFREKSEKIMKKSIILDVIPKTVITKLVGGLTKNKISKPLIKPYCWFYKIDLSEVEKNVREYENLNEFFTRKLKTGERTIASNEIVSPVDGYVKEVGKIEKGNMIQVKGVNYNIRNLLKKEEAWKDFEDGYFVNIYLSPKNYHRIHSPADAEIERFEHVEGKLYPVNKLGVENIEGLYTKNERINIYMENDNYKIAMANVGAMIVGSVKIKDEEIKKNEVKEKRKKIGKGEEVGKFEFGSTVVLLIKNKNEETNVDIKEKTNIKLGEKII